MERDIAKDDFTVFKQSIQKITAEEKKCYKVKKARDYLTATQVEVHYLPAVLCNVANARVRQSKAATCPTIRNTSHIQQRKHSVRDVPHNPVDRKALKISTKTGNSFNSFVRDFLTCVQVQEL